MNIEDLNLLYDYNYWANRRLLAAAARVSPEQFVAPADYPYGGLRGTLVHILDTEYGWREFCRQGVSMPDSPEADFPTLAALEARWREEETAMRDFLASLTDETTSRLVRYTTSSGQLRERLLWHCLLHVVNHGTQHRAEAAAILTGYGQSPGDVDFTLFLNERGSS